MVIIEFLCGFKFEQHNVIDDQIGNVFSNNLFMEVNLDRYLLPDIQALLTKNYGESIFINLFRKAIAKFFMCLKERTDNFSSQV